MIFVKLSSIKKILCYAKKHGLLMAIKHYLHIYEKYNLFLEYENELNAASFNNFNLHSLKSTKRKIYWIASSPVITRQDSIGDVECNGIKVLFLPLGGLGDLIMARNYILHFQSCYSK